MQNHPSLKTKRAHTKSHGQKVRGLLHHAARPGPYADRRGDQRRDGEGAEGAEREVRGGAEDLR